MVELLEQDTPKEPITVEPEREGGIASIVMVSMGG